MSLLEAITEIAAAPIRCADELRKDITFDNDDEMDTPLCFFTLGASSILRGIGKSIEKAAQKID